MNMDLFGNPALAQREPLGAGSAVLRGFALTYDTSLLTALKEIELQAPFRRMLTPGGFKMSVAMSNCGHFGWLTDRTGYRYDAIDPDSGKPWPAMPQVFLKLAAEAALAAGFGGFIPDACLINRYEAGARMSLHQDKDEQDFSQPIVSVSLGLPAIFQFGGCKRTDKPIRLLLEHGDVVVWGGADRLRFHGVLPIKPGHHSQLGSQRINLTFRKAA